MYRSLFPKHVELPRTEGLRVISSTPEVTIVRVIETNPLFEAEEWKLLTSRVPPTWRAGDEVAMTFTPMELEWLQGKRELE